MTVQSYNLLIPANPRTWQTLSMITVTHVITNLAVGGAETMLLKLIRHTSPQALHRVISLQGLGVIGQVLRDEGITVDALRTTSPPTYLPMFWKLAHAIGSAPSDVVQGWMYHGNLAASVACRLTGRAMPGWSIRCTIGRERALTRLAIRLGARWSKTVPSIIYNSERARLEHEAIGYSSLNAIVIPNGFDLARFRPDDALRSQVRARFGFSASDVVVCQTARLHAMKNHVGLVAAVARLASRQPNVRLLLAGNDVPNLAARFPEAAPAVRALGNRLTLLPTQADVVPLLAATDIFVLASINGEGFPNALGEAMAMALPCIATDVGDSADILGDCGTIVPAGSTDALERAFANYIERTEEERRSLGRAARKRVEERYAIEPVAQSYMSEWTRLCRGMNAERQPCAG